MNNLQYGLDVLGYIQEYVPSAILAGGFLRDSLALVEPKDIDIFVPASATLPDFIGDFKLRLVHDHCYTFSSEVSKVYELDGFQFPVQVIVLAQGMDPVERVKHHDFGLCQVWADGPFVSNVQATMAYRWDEVCRRFTLVHCESEDEFKRSMRRYERLKQKYPDYELWVPQRYSHLRATNEGMRS